MPVIPYTKTPVDTEGSWDGPQMEGNLPNDAGADTFRKAYAWVDPSKDPDTKTAYKFIHHNVSASGKVGAANYKACTTGIGVLNGGRGGTNIPEADRKAVYNHFAAHIRDAGEEPPSLNNLSDRNAQEKVTNHLDVHVAKNSLVDEGNGTVTFQGGLVITDDSEQWNGTRYDIPTLEISQYNKKVTADHIDSIRTLVGVVGNVFKQGSKVLIDNIRFAVKESADALLAYNLMRGGFLTDVSIETTGIPPDEEGIYHNSSLCGLSVVVTGNNKNAHINQVVANSIAQSKEQGLDTTEIEKQFSVELEEEQDMKFVTIKNGRDFAVAVTYRNAADEDVETEVAPGKSVDVSEEQKDSVEKQLSDAKAPEAENNSLTGEELTNAINQALSAQLKPLQEKIDAVEQNVFDKGVQEPGFKKDANARNGIRDTKNEFASMDWQDRHAKQINAAWDLLKRHDSQAAEVLNKINEVNLNALKKDGVVRNSLTLGDFGNFVISRELLSEIEGCRNDYTPLVSATQWKETLSTQFAWLKRSGDINMQSVEFCDDGANGNLKPISDYSASIQTADLEELAAVTPVCNAATRFLAADLLGDVAAGYRNDYDRKRAQLVIAKLEGAVEVNGNSVVYDVNPQVGALTTWVDTWAQIATCTPNGTFVFNTSTYAEVMKQAVQNGVNGPLSNIFVTGQIPTIFGRPFIVVPDDMMPSLNSAGTVSIAVNGATVTVNHAVFYANMNNFTGRTSGGLLYDLADQAAYEDNGTVKSAFQRNEIVLRGSFFRGGAIKDTDQVAGILSPGVS